MRIWTRRLSWAVLLVMAGSCAALEPNEILVVVNGQIPQSVQVGQYYCQQRSVPVENIVSIALGAKPVDTMDRDDYNRFLAWTIRDVVQSVEEPETIRCVVTCWGVPFRVKGRGIVPGMEGRVKELQSQLDQERKAGADKDSPAIKQREADLDQLQGDQTNASVDSELSMVLFGDYELFRWHPNTYKDDEPNAPFRVLMVSRLDGPSPEIARGLVDKALAAEKTGLRGTIYLDSRGSRGNNDYARYDRSLKDLAAWAAANTDLPVKHDTAPALFAPGSCPNAALYCGWYSLKKYVDAFDFVEGAVGFHMASYEAANLRDPNSPQWCPAMLRDGITATIGPVTEPFLSAFPLPLDFFKELFQGRCLAEAFYRTNPFNSWQMLLIGDPLYTPFRKR